MVSAPAVLIAMEHWEGPRVLTWWMMPEPGFQKPMPYLAPADDRKSYTSLLVVIACCRSATPPNELFLPPAEPVHVSTCSLYNKGRVTAATVLPLAAVRLQPRLAESHACGTRSSGGYMQ